MTWQLAHAFLLSFSQSRADCLDLSIQHEPFSLLQDAIAPCSRTALALLRPITGALSDLILEESNIFVSYDQRCQRKGAKGDRRESRVVEAEDDN